MITECEVCGSKDIEYVYLNLCYKCNFCKTNTYGSYKRPSKRKTSFIFLKQVDFKIWMDKSKKRYIYLNGVALRKYSQIEIVTMKNDFIELNMLKEKFLNEKISYNDFIKRIKDDYNDFGAKFYNEQQCKVELNINEREEHINRMNNSGYESDWFIVVCCDLKNSSQLIDNKENNLKQVSDFIYELNDGLVGIFKSAYYKQNMGDGFMALYKSADMKEAIKAIQNLNQFSITLDKKINSDLRNKIGTVNLGIALDYSKVIIIYSQGDVLTGLAVNKASKLCKIHLRNIEEGVCLSTPRLMSVVPDFKCKNIIVKDNQMDTFVLSADELSTLML